MGRGEQIFLQLVAIGATWIWSFVLTSVILLAIKYSLELRVREEEAAAGLDVSEHGEAAYTL